jgi:DNA-3-methyladenine glycosylase
MQVSQSFFRGPTVTVAKRLLGSYLVSRSKEGVTIGRIVETEAYLGLRDSAAHSYRGQSRRNTSMFLEAGHAYVYFIYGMYHCMNVVTRSKGIGEAVLIRALEPVEGIELMQKRRGKIPEHELCRGPGRLTMALGITPADDGCSLFKGRLTIHSPQSFGRYPRAKILCSRRIGITQAAELPLRFFLFGNEFVSGSKKQNAALISP